MCRYNLCFGFLLVLALSLAVSRSTSFDDPAGGTYLGSLEQYDLHVSYFYLSSEIFQQVFHSTKWCRVEMYLLPIVNLVEIRCAFNGQYPKCCSETNRS